MAKNIINFNEKSEKTLDKVRLLCSINGESITTKEKQVETSLVWLDKLLTSLNDETLKKVLNITKNLQ